MDPRPKTLYAIITLVKFILPGRHAPVLITIAGALAFGLIGAVLYILYKGRDEWAQSVRELPTNVRELDNKKQSIIVHRMLAGGSARAAVALSNVFGPMYLDRYVIGAARRSTC